MAVKGKNRLIISNCQLYFSPLETLRYMVAEGVGCTLLPEFSVPKTNIKRVINLLYTIC